jgi:hypothetical protein
MVEEGRLVDCLATKLLVNSLARQPASAASRWSTVYNSLVNTPRPQPTRDDDDDDHKAVALSTPSALLTGVGQRSASSGR